MLLATKPENELDVLSLFDALSALPVGETASYDDLSARIGRPVQRVRHILARARELAEKQHGHLYEAVRNVGIRRLPADATTGVGLAVLRTIRSRSRRGVTRLGRLSYNDLTPDAATKLIAQRSQLGALALVSDGRKTAAVVSEVQTAGAAVPAGRVLDLFTRGT